MFFVSAARRGLRVLTLVGTEGDWQTGAGAGAGAGEGNREGKGVGPRCINM